MSTVMVLRNRGGAGQTWLNAGAEPPSVGRADSVNDAVEAGIEAHSSLPLQVGLISIPRFLTVPLISHPTLPSPSPSHTHHTHTHTHTSVSLAELLWPTSSHSHFASLLHLKYHPLLHNTRGSFLLHFASCSVGKLILSQPALLPSVWHGAIRCLSCVTLRHRLPSTSTSIFSSCGLSPRCG
jgi:hypothetical protein